MEILITIAFIVFVYFLAKQLGRDEVIREQQEKREQEKQLQEQEKRLQEYLALSDEEKLITKIEENKDLNEIQRLLDVVPLESARSSDGVTPIIATMRGNSAGNHERSQNRLILGEILRRLPSERRLPALNARDQKGWTALMYAISIAQPVDVLLLIHLGADPEIRDTSGASAFDLVRAKYARYPALLAMDMKILEGKGVPQNQPNMKIMFDKVLAEWGKW